MSKDSSINLRSEFNRQCCCLLDQSLIKIEHCLQQLDNEQIWWRPEPSLNSIGNLLLHMNGNLQQWAIASFSESPDKRDRASEFSIDRNESKAQLIALTTETINEAKRVIRTVPENRWLAKTSIQGFEVTGVQAILHTTAHFQGHTHQIILMTRLQLGEAYRFQWNPSDGFDNLPM